MKAYELKKSDDVSFFEIGMTYIFGGNPQKAIIFLTRSAKANTSNADACYYLAYELYQTGDFANAALYSINSYNLYKDSQSKNSAARMTANIYADMGDYKNSLAYFDKAVDIDQMDYISYNGKIMIYLKQKDFDRAVSAGEEFFSNMNLYPEVLSMINKDFIELHRYGDLDKFYSDMIKKFSKDPAVSGDLFLYKGIYYAKLNNKDEAVSALNKSKEYFKKIFSSDNGVFEVINEWLDSLDQSKNI